MISAKTWNVGPLKYALGPIIAPPNSVAWNTKWVSIKTEPSGQSETEHYDGPEVGWPLLSPESASVHFLYIAILNKTIASKQALSGGMGVGVCFPCVTLFLCVDPLSCPHR